MENDKHGRSRNSVSIPLDLMIEILTRLPVKFKCLSKLYSSIIQGRNFVDSFLSYSSNRPCVLFSFTTARELVLYSATTTHTSSTTSTVANHVMTVPGNMLRIRTPLVRGLVCYSIRRNQHVICNPSTRQLLHLPHNQTWKEDDFAEYLLFGYEPISNRFKVISILTGSWDLEHQFWIFTVGDGNSWRKIQDIPYPYRPVFECPLGVCINGVLYYKAYTKSHYDSGTIQVVSFDLNSEKFSLIKLPPDSSKIPKLIDFQGKLAFIDHIVEEIRVWVLENDEWSFKSYNLPWSYENCRWFYERSVAIVFLPPRVHRLLTWHLNLEKNTIRNVDTLYTILVEYEDEHGRTCSVSKIVQKISKYFCYSKP